MSGMVLLAHSLAERPRSRFYVFAAGFIILLSLGFKFFHPLFFDPVGTGVGIGVGGVLCLIPYLAKFFQKKTKIIRY